MLCAACTAVSKVVWRCSMMSLRSCTSASVAMTISANRALASMSKILALKLSFCIGILRERTAGPRGFIILSFSTNETACFAMAQCFANGCRHGSAQADRVP